MSSPVLATAVVALHTVAAAMHKRARREARGTIAGSTTVPADQQPGGGKRARTKDGWVGFLAQQQEMTTLMVRSFSLHRLLADGTQTLDQRWVQVRAAVESARERPMNFYETNANGATLLMAIFDFVAGLHDSAPTIVQSMTGSDPLPYLFHAVEQSRASFKDAIDERGRNVINVACCFSFNPHTRLFKLVRHLLKLGASPNNRDPTRSHATPLVSLARSSRNPPEVCDLLMQHGADPNIADDAGNTQLHMLVRYSNSAVFEHVVSTKIFRDCDFFLRNRDDQTFDQLAVAVSEKSPEKVAAKAIATMAVRFRQQWSQVMLPKLVQELVEPECTGLLPDLVDLALQYLDGHGHPFPPNDDNSRMEIETTE